MPEIKYVGPFDSADLPLLRRTFKRGEVFEVTADEAKELLDQPANYVPADKPKSTTKAKG